MIDKGINRDREGERGKVIKEKRGREKRREKRREKGRKREKKGEKGRKRERKGERNNKHTRVIVSNISITYQLLFISTTLCVWA